MASVNIKKELKNSSVYAVAQVAKARSSFRKAWWIFVLLVGLSGSSWQIVRFCKNYFEYPMTVNVRMDSEQDFFFPSVTVCNLNRLRKKFTPCMVEGRPLEECNKRGSGPGGSLVFPERRTISSCSTHFSGILDSRKVMFQTFLSNYTALSSAERKLGGYPKEVFIRECLFDGISCENDFTYFQNLKYGNCFTFNKNKDRSNNPNPWILGSMKGLTLSLYLEPRGYLPVTESTGARVVVHNPYDDPDPEEKGINVSPSVETSILVTRKNMQRLQAPYEDRCIHYDRRETSRIRSRKDCVRDCIQRQNLDSCSCFDPTLPFADDRMLCNMTNREEACCLDEVLENMTLQGLPCDCPLPCVSSEYRLQISTAVLASSSSDEVKLRIYMSNAQTTTFVHEARYQPIEFFGSLGGHLSLWLGLSLCIVFEILQYPVYFIVLIFRKLKK